MTEWKTWQGCILPVRRKRIAIYPKTGRQLFGYLTFQARAAVATITFRLDEADGRLVLPIESHRAHGFTSWEAAE